MKFADGLWKTDRQRRPGRTPLPAIRFGYRRLLLVIDGGAGDFLAVRVGGAGRYGAALAIGGENHAAGDNYLVPLFCAYRDGVIVNGLQGSGVRAGIASDG